MIMHFSENNKGQVRMKHAIYFYFAYVSTFLLHLSSKELGTRYICILYNELFQQKHYSEVSCL